MKFSLIIPCYNEEKNLPLLFERCMKLTALNGHEIIIVNNGSTDKSNFVINELVKKYKGFKCVNVKVNRGYGFGILSGLKEASGEILAWTHADMQTDPLDIVKGIPFFNKYGKKIFVKGSRYGRPISDSFFTLAMSIYESILLRVKLWDINAQPTMFHRDFFAEWHNPPHDFSLDLYAYYHAKALNLKVFRFPVLFSQRVFGSSHWNINWQAKIKFIKRTIDYSRHLKKMIKK
jgi:glycosyltransferase involved in cell wall biosynthesis